MRTSHTWKTSRHATDRGCCHGSEKQHWLQTLQHSRKASKAYPLLFLYTKFILVLGKIFRLQDVFTTRTTLENTSAMCQCTFLSTFLFQQSLTPLMLHLRLWNHVEDDVCMPLAPKTLASALLAELTLPYAVELSTDHCLSVLHYMLSVPRSGGDY
jgi:hypothetical protein